MAQAAFIIRPAGNYHFYSLKDAEPSLDWFYSFGGVRKQFLTDVRTVLPGARRIFFKFGAPAVSTSLQREDRHQHSDLLVELYDEMDLSDVELIPLRLDEEGNHCWYLLTHEGKRILFSGASVVLDHGRIGFCEHPPRFNRLLEVLDEIEGQPVDYWIPERYRGVQRYLESSPIQWEELIQALRRKWRTKTSSLRVINPMD